MTKYWLSNKTLLATAISTVMLAGCGGGDDDTDTDAKPVGPSLFTVTAIDGYLVNANILADEDGDGECETVLTTTGKGGTAEIFDGYKDKQICVKANAGRTIDETRGLVNNTFSLKAMAGSPVISPVTDLVVSKVSQLDGDATDEEKQAAIQEVADALGVEVAQLSRDFLNVETGNEKLAIISEVLVDSVHTKDTPTSPQETLNIARELSNIVEKHKDDLTDFHPIIGESGLPESNHRPTVKGTITEISVDINDVVNEFSLADFFDDKEDGKTLTYDVQALESRAPSLKIDSEGTVAGFTARNAGEFNYQFFAIDSKGVQSRPLEWKLTVIPDNYAPELNNDAFLALVDKIWKLKLVKGVEVNESFDVSDLFEDAESDPLIYEVREQIGGLTIEVVDSYLTLTGTPSEAGQFGFYISVSDSINTATGANFHLTVSDSDAEVLHPLEGKLLYKLDAMETIPETVNSGYYRFLECHTLKAEDGKLYFNSTADGIERSAVSCPEEALEPVADYTAEGDTLKITPLDTNETANTDILILHHDTESDSYLVKVTSGVDDEIVDQMYTNKAEAEARLAYSGGQGDVTANYFLPQGNFQTTYVKGQISASLSQNRPEIVLPPPNIQTFSGDDIVEHGDFGRYDADVFFTAPAGYSFNSQPFSCSFAREVFDAFYLSSVSKGWTVDSTPLYFDEIIDKFECYESVEDGNPTIAIDLDFNEDLVDGDHYTITAKMKSKYQDQFEKVGFSFIYRDFICSEGDTERKDNDDPAEFVNKDAFHAAVTDCQLQSESTKEIIETLSLALGGEYFDLFDQDMFYRIYADGQIGIHEKNDNGNIEELFKGAISYTEQGYLQSPMLSFIEEGENGEADQEHTYQVTMAITNLDEPLSSDSLSQVSAKFFKHSSMYDADTSKGWIESWALTLKD